MLDTAEHIQIATCPFKQAVNIPFLGHSLANESIFNPPLGCIDEANILDVRDKVKQDIYNLKQERYEPPDTLEFTNKDCNPIILGSNLIYHYLEYFPLLTRNIIETWIWKWKQ